MTGKQRNSRRTALVDCDVIVYQCAFANQGIEYLHVKEDGEVAEVASSVFPEANCEVHWTSSVPQLHMYIDMSINGILSSVNATDYKCYLTGKGNFREQVATWGKYKGGRPAKPRLYQEARDYIADKWEAEIVEGMEADDALGIYQCSHENTVICSIDKDLLMIPGDHYNFRNNTHMTIDHVTAMRNFYRQCLTGDAIDNIPGLRKWTGKNATKRMKEALEEMEAPAEMEEHVIQCYLDAGGTVDQFAETSQLLWILREPL